MRIAVLPFNAAEGTKQAFGRQFAAFVGDQVRTATGADINTVSFLAQIDQGDGERVGFVNIGEGFLEGGQLQEMIQQTDVGLLVDGSVAQEGDAFDVTVRFHKPGVPEPVEVDEYKFTETDIFKILHTMVKKLAERGGLELPDNVAGEAMEFGTDSAKAMLLFFEGYDGYNYVQQAQGRVVKEFDPGLAMNAFLQSLEIDADFVAPYAVLCEFSRMCAGAQLGSFEGLVSALKRAIELVPDEFNAYFALGELYGLANLHNEAAEAFEKAIQRNQEEPALYTRLGMAQMAMGMPVNAERNFKKAVELEGDDKPSMDYLAMVLQQSGREHEIPGLWKDLLDKDPSSPQANVKYAMSLWQTGKKEEAEKAFEKGLEAVEENAVVKRYYAPVLAEQGELDRAMDFYEDCLDVAPTDIALMLEYARVLGQAGRDFEVAPVLKNVLNANPDQNTRAQTLAWLIELEQPKRVEGVAAAQDKLESDPEGALRDLKPLKNWLADYWKMWALLANCYNRLEQPEEAEEAAKRLIDLFPGFEGGYAEFASALNAQGKHDEAYNLMRYAASNIPNSLPIAINLGLAARRAGHEDEARHMAKQLREALGPNEELEPVLREMEG